MKLEGRALIKIRPARIWDQTGVTNDIIGKLILEIV